MSVLLLMGSFASFPSLLSNHAYLASPTAALGVAVGLLAEHESFSGNCYVGYCNSFLCIYLNC